MTNNIECYGSNMTIAREKVSDHIVHYGSSDPRSGVDANGAYQQGAEVWSTAVCVVCREEVRVRVNMVADARERALAASDEDFDPYGFSPSDFVWTLAPHSVD